MWWYRNIGVVTGCVALMIGGSAIAEDAASKPTEARQPHQANRADGQKEARTFRPQVWRGDRIIGVSIKNPQNQHLGTISDLVLSPDRKSLNYAVISSGGLAGFGAKLTAIPWAALQPNGDQKTMMVHLTEQELKAAPSFESDQWVKMTDQMWLKKVDGYFADNVEIARQDRQANRTGSESLVDAKHLWSYRIGRLMDLDIENEKNESLGEIEAIYIDMHDGHPVYARVGFGGFLGLGEKNAYVPWNALRIDPVKELGYLHATPDQMDEYANEDAKAGFDLNDPATAEQIHRRFKQKPYWTLFGYTLTAEKVDRSQAWRPESEYNKRFDADATATVEGKIQSVTHFNPAAGAAEGIALKVDGSDGKPYTIHTGPKHFLDAQGVEFNRGDRVKVTGSRASFDGKSVLMAIQIECNDKTIQLRDKSGEPRWPRDIAAQ